MLLQETSSEDSDGSSDTTEKQQIHHYHGSILHYLYIFVGAKFRGVATQAFKRNFHS